MARIPRRYLVSERSVNHCTWRAHNHERIFDTPGAFAYYYRLLLKYKTRCCIRIHGFCFMTTHVHVTCSAEAGQKAFSSFWKVVNQCFARWYNRQHQRCGQVVMERLRSPRIQNGLHELQVMRYGDMNPVRAGMVRRPKNWNWSSYRHYAFGKADPLIDDAPEYLALGNTGPARRKAYLGLFAARFIAACTSRCKEIVNGPFFGDATWVKESFFECGLSPPYASTA